MDSSELKISIITVTFNAESHLPVLIESLRNQTDKNFEWIVVDGASKDRTVDLISSASDVVSKWISEPDFGIFHAMNKAVNMASGEYYLVLGADDYLLPDAIVQYKESATQNKPDIVTAKILIRGMVHKREPNIPWIYGVHAYISEHSVGTLIKRTLHEKYGMYSNRFPVGADFYFLKIVCNDRNTTIYRADFVAGEYGTTGISSIDKAAGFCDYFRIQFETENNKLFQVFYFVLKLIWRTPVLIRSVRHKH
jgi:glycosyltransferase involved in cell wall biosynthesis